MIVYVLTASSPNSDGCSPPPETHVFTGEDAWMNAHIQALNLIVEHVAGTWDRYKLSHLRRFKQLVEDRSFFEARRQWNAMSSYQLDIEDIETKEHAPEPPGFNWPEEL